MEGIVKQNRDHTLNITTKIMQRIISMEFPIFLSNSIMLMASEIGCCGMKKGQAENCQESLETSFLK